MRVVVLLVYDPQALVRQQVLGLNCSREELRVVDSASACRVGTPDDLRDRLGRQAALDKSVSQLSGVKQAIFVPVEEVELLLEVRKLF